MVVMDIGKAATSMFLEGDGSLYMILVSVGLAAAAACLPCRP